MGVNAGFRNHDEIMSCLVQHGDQFFAGGEVGGQIPQITVINADDFRLQRDGAVHFFFVTDFGKNIQRQAVSQAGESAVSVVVQHTQHQQNSISVIMTGQINLILVHKEIFVQNRL